MGGAMPGLVPVLEGGLPEAHRHRYALLSPEAEESEISHKQTTRHLAELDPRMGAAECGVCWRLASPRTMVAQILGG